MQFLLTQLALKLTTPFTIQARLVRRLLATLGAGSFVAVQGGTVPLAADYMPVVSNFSMSKTEITQGQWRAVMTDTPTGMATTNGTADNNPVTYINWFESVIFCNKLSEKENKTPCYYYGDNITQTDYNTWKNGQIPDSSSHANYTDWNNNIKCNWTANGYRLPTEAECVYAARGDINHSAFTYSGSDTVDNVAVAYSAKNALCFALKLTAF